MSVRLGKKTYKNKYPKGGFVVSLKEKPKRPYLFGGK
jgi:hypothetical protein